jgi:NitT/TauT family transport system ATP-binding protein
VLKVTGLGKVYGSGGDATVAIKSLSFEVRANEFLSIVGPSGCGKTTLLKCAAGLMLPTAGEVLLDGHRVDGPMAGMALVFQEYGRSLFPWMTVAQNVGFPLRRRRLDRRRQQELVAESLQAVALGDFAKRYPWQLSGGMQQRVAIARALAYQPQIMLMDEPFASVDAQTRADLEDLVLRVWSEFKVTILFVTHDIDEAIYLGDRVLVLTPRPTEIKEVVEVELPRPRDQVATKEEPAFAHLRAHVYRSIKG